MIEVDLPDGSVAEFPDGTPPETIKAALQKRFAPKSLDQRISGAIKSVTDVTGGVVNRVMESASLGVLGDEFRAGVGAAASPKTYDQALSDERKAERDFAAAHPVWDVAAGIAGGMLPIGGVVSLPARALSMGQKIARGFGAGGIMGLINGFMEGEGGASSRASDAAVTGALGAGVGAAAAPAVAAVGKVAGAVKEPVLGALGIGNGRRVERAVAEAMRRAGMSDQDIAAALAKAAADGQTEYALVDALGNPGQRMLAGIAKRPGDARKEIADFLDARQQGQGERIASFVEDAFGFRGDMKPSAGTAVVPQGHTFIDTPADVLRRPQRSAAAATDALKTARGTAADAAYAAAREGAAPVDVRGALAAIDQRLAPMQGSGVADDGIGKKLAQFRARLAAPQKALGPGETARELSDFDRVLGVKQDVQDAIGEAVRAGRNNEARVLGGVQRELDAALEAASPGYRKANDEFAAASRVIGAVDEGADMGRPGARYADTTARVAEMTPDERAAARIGYGGRLLARSENADAGINKAKPFTSQKSVAERNALALDPDLLQRRIQREQQMYSTRGQATGGSPTAENQADQADSARVEMSALGHLLFGNPKAAAQQLMSAVSHAMGGKNEQTRSMIAKALLSNDPSKILQQAARRGQIDQSTVALIEAAVNSAGARAVYLSVQAP